MKSVFCSHCNTEVAERTFRQHKAAFYDSFRNTWRQTDTAISPLKKRPRQINSDEELGSEVESANEFETTSLDDDLDSIQTEDVIFEEIHLDPICAFVSEKIEEVWENESVEDVIADLSTACLSDIATTKCSSEGSTSTREATIELTRWILLFVGSWSTAFNIPMSAVEYFLLFLHAVFSVCSAFSPALSLVVDVLPKSIYQFKKSQGFLYDDFKKYAVCPKCHALYDLKVCDKSKSGPPRCTFIQHPNHPQKRFREQCGTELFREIILTNGSKKYYPVKTFCWKSIRETLQAFLNRKGFQKSCEAWRNRTLIPGTLRDVYDGRVWKSFQNLESVGPFLQLPRRFGLMLNVDWFQPFKHSPYSVGVIYLAILNLPREIRFTKDNVMIVGVIPGPGEPSKSINTYLEPIVAELLELWTDGFSCKGVDDAKVIMIIYTISYMT